MKDQLESLVGQLVERGILLDEAVNEFEKKFIKRVLENLKGNQSRAAKVLGIHRNTLSRKVANTSLSAPAATTAETSRVPRSRMADPYSDRPFL